ncbi:hypothetical protein ACFL4O_02440 [bacterium]
MKQLTLDILLYALMAGEKGFYKTLNIINKNYNLGCKNDEIYNILSAILRSKQPEIKEILDKYKIVKTYIYYVLINQGKKDEIINKTIEEQKIRDFLKSLFEKENEDMKYVQEIKLELALAEKSEEEEKLKKAEKSAREKRWAQARIIVEISETNNFIEEKFLQSIWELEYKFIQKYLTEELFNKILTNKINESELEFLSREKSIYALISNKIVDYASSLKDIIELHVLKEKIEQYKYLNLTSYDADDKLEEIPALTRIDDRLRLKIRLLELGTKVEIYDELSYALNRNNDNLSRKFFKLLVEHKKNIVDITEIKKDDFKKLIRENKKEILKVLLNCPRPRKMVLSDKELMSLLTTICEEPEPDAEKMAEWDREEFKKHDAEWEIGRIVFCLQKEILLKELSKPNNISICSLDDNLKYIMLFYAINQYHYNYLSYYLMSILGNKALAKIIYNFQDKLLNIIEAALESKYFETFRLLLRNKYEFNDEDYKSIKETAKKEIKQIPSGKYNIKNIIEEIDNYKKYMHILSYFPKHKKQLILNKIFKDKMLDLSRLNRQLREYFSINGTDTDIKSFLKNFPYSRNILEKIFMDLTEEKFINSENKDNPGLFLAEYVRDNFIKKLREFPIGDKEIDWNILFSAVIRGKKGDFKILNQINKTLELSTKKARNIGTYNNILYKILDSDNKEIQKVFAEHEDIITYILFCLIETGERENLINIYTDNECVKIIGKFLIDLIKDKNTLKWDIAVILTYIIKNKKSNIHQQQLIAGTYNLEFIKKLSQNKNILNKLAEDLFEELENKEYLGRQYKKIFEINRLPDILMNKITEHILLRENSDEATQKTILTLSRALLKTEKELGIKLIDHKKVSSILLDIHKNQCTLLLPFPINMYQEITELSTAIGSLLKETVLKILPEIFTIRNKTLFEALFTRYDINRFLIKELTISNIRKRWETLTERYSILKDWKEEHKKTPIELALLNNNMEAVIVCLEYRGVKVSAKTAIKLIKTGNEEVIRLVIEKHNLYKEAIKKGKKEIVKAFLQKEILPEKLLMSDFINIIKEEGGDWIKNALCYYIENELIKTGKLNKIKKILDQSIEKYRQEMADIELFIENTAKLFKVDIKTVLSAHKQLKQVYQASELIKLEFEFNFDEEESDPWNYLVRGRDVFDKELQSFFFLFGRCIHNKKLSRDTLIVRYLYKTGVVIVERLQFKNNEYMIIEKRIEKPPLRVAVCLKGTKVFKVKARDELLFIGQLSLLYQGLFKNLISITAVKVQEIHQIVYTFINKKLREVNISDLQTFKNIIKAV